MISLFGNKKQNIPNSVVDKEIYAMFRSMYDGDYIKIIDVLKYFYKDTPYSEDYFNEMRIQHHDIIKKSLNRLTAGIYDKEPVRGYRVMDGKDMAEENEYLHKVLTSCDYHNKIKESFRIAKFFNVAMVFPVVRNGELCIDLLTPEQYEVKVHDNDYYKLKAVYVRKQKDSDVYFSYWDDSSHYLIETDGRTRKVNNGNVNPIKELPFHYLRMNDGKNFYGVPDWDLFLNQLAIDMKLTDFDKAEAFQRNAILFGVNTNIPDGKRVSPGQMIQEKNENPSKPPVTLQYVSAQTNFGDSRTSIDWRIESTLRSKGIIGSSASTESKPMSGLAKEIDEISILEERDQVKSKLWRFEVVLINKIIKVWNEAVSSGRLDKNLFVEEIKNLPDMFVDVNFVGDEKYESEEEKAIRRNMEKNNFIKDEINFIMEDLNINEQKAIKHYEEIKARQKKLGLNDPSQKDRKNVPQEKFKSLSQRLLGESYDV